MLDITQAFRKTTNIPLKGTVIKEGWELVVRLTPKASHTKIGDVSIDANGLPFLKVYVTAVPEDNKANKALIELLSKTFRIAKTSIYIISGLTDRRKVLWFETEACPIIVRKKQAS